MTELPKSVKSRLRQTQGSGVPHPEADLLSAFAEQALPAAERESVLAHLAQCADCREVLALSAPVEPPRQAGGAVGGWLRPEFWRWGIVAASATVVVAAVLLVKPEFQNQGTRVERQIVLDRASEKASEAQQPGASQDKAAEQEPALAKKADAAGERKSAAPEGEQRLARQERPARSAEEKAVGEQSLAAPAAPPPPPVRDANALNTFGGGRANAVGGLSRADNLIVGQKVQPAAPTAKEGQAAKSADTKTESQLLAASGSSARESDVVRRYGPAATGQSAANDLAFKDEAKAAEEPAAGYVVVPALKASRAMERSKSKPSQAMTMERPVDMRPRTWRIVDGKLEWSLDGGTTWSRVDAPGGARFLSVDSRPGWVWAGTTSGMVFRSVDNGSTWIPVSAGWSGDVIYLKFEDEKRGLLKTSTREEWVTEDGGLSWKQSAPRR